MKKTLVISIVLDDVDIEDLQVIQDELDTFFNDYPFKRISITIQAESLIAPRP